MDIRSYFCQTSTKNKGAAAQSFTHITKKDKDQPKVSTKKRRLVIVDSDSDEEPLPSKKPNTVKITETTITQTRSKPNLAALQKRKTDEKLRQQISPNDFFKSTPSKPHNGHTVAEELDIIDDDFDETLNQLDQKSSPVKPKTAEPVRKYVTIRNEEVTKSPPPQKTKSSKVPESVGKTSKRAKDEKTVTDQPTKKIKCEVLDDSPVKKITSEVVDNKPVKKIKCELLEPVKKIKNEVTDDKPSSKAKDHSKQRDSKPNISKTKDEEARDVPKIEDVTPEDKSKRNSLNYRNYLHREGPQALGSKEIPTGQENCLHGLTFILTGVLESFERDEMKDLIVSYGGKVMTTLSKTTKYMVVGRDAGPAKLEKADKLGTTTLTEDELLELIRTRPGKATSKPISKIVKQPPDEKPIVKIEMGETSASEVTNKSTSSVPLSNAESMWVDKYKPTSLKQVIGQQGDRSCANKLLYWLRNWHKNHIPGRKAVGGKWNSKEDGSMFKAALLSGPPGIGKTTSAQLALKELGYEFVELNASDTRSKKCLQSEVAEVLQNKTISGLFQEQVDKKHAIIFDEVDGMSGNEDRGGTQELISLIKQSKIPVICICNDRAHPKIRSLSNHCFDLRFFRPRVEQIKASMMSLLHKEKMKVPPETLHEIITATNQDLRQVLNHLSYLSSRDTSSMINAKTASKDVKLSPFDALKKVFSLEGATSNINEKASLFFHDYSLAPLFVHENYPAAKPISVKGDIHKHLMLLSETADSVSYGDVIDRTIRSSNNWSLLPTQAIFASVVPGDNMRGYLSQMINFPSWLGKNSSKNHMDRILQHVHMHTRLNVSANKTELGLDYLQQLKYKLTKPLEIYGSEGVPEVLSVMENYFLLREDFDSVVELSLWPGQKDPMSNVEPKVKAALTRTYNKESFKTPYAVINVKKGKKRSAADDSLDNLDGDAEIEDAESDNDDLSVDAMVKQKKQSKAKETSEPETSGKGKGKGKKSTSSSRGRGKGKK